MATTYVKNIEGHMVKDEEARTSLQTLTSTVNNQTAIINSHTTKLQELDGLSHLKPQYDATTESITFK